MENYLEKKKECSIQKPSIVYKDSYLSALKESHKENRNLYIEQEEIENNFDKFNELPRGRA